MQDSRSMSTRKALGHLRREGQRSRERERRAGAQELAQAAALNELHRDEEQALGLLHRVEVNDVGMIERGRGSGFPLKPRAAIGRVGDVRTKKLERHSPVELACPRRRTRLPCRRGRALPERGSDRVVGRSTSGGLPPLGKSLADRHRRERGLAALAAPGFGRSRGARRASCTRGRTTAGPAPRCASGRPPLRSPRLGRGCRGPRRSTSPRRPPPGS